MPKKLSLLQQKTERTIFKVDGCMGRFPCHLIRSAKPAGVLPTYSLISRKKDSPLIEADVINLSVVGSKLTGDKAYDESIIADHIDFSSDWLSPGLV